MFNCFLMHINYHLDCFYNRCMCCLGRKNSITVYSKMLGCFNLRMGKI